MATNEELQINEIVDIYKKVKLNTIQALRMRGLSINEIVRRLGGSSKPVIIKLLKEVEKKDA